VSARGRPRAASAGTQLAAPTGRRRVWRAVEVAVVALCSIALAGGLIVILSGYFVAHDPAGLDIARAHVGRAFKDQGDALLAPGAPAPRYDSDPPTSGAHRYEPVTRQLTVLNDNQLLTALSTGDVVILYGTATPPPGLQAVARALAGPFTPALAAAGEAVILARDPGIHGLIALGWTRMAHLSGPADPLLARFIELWLGHGAILPGGF
jgi:hypothetical protein